MKKLEFGLTKGMTGRDIVTILKGHVSGETAQELVPFFAESEIPFKESDPQEREVLESNDDYALLARRRKTHAMVNDADGKPHKGKEITFSMSKYMSGINDEGKYFLHEVDMAPRTVQTLDQMNDWMNRIDQGYVSRVQGDILYQYLLKSTNMQIIIQPNYSGYFVNRRYVSSSEQKTFETKIYLFPNGMQAQMNPSLSPNITNSIQIGNHRLSTDGTILVSQTSEPEIIVDGKWAILQHGQHGLKKEEIPDGHLLLLAPQRGRQMSVSGNMIYWC